MRSWTHPRSHRQPNTPRSRSHMPTRKTGVICAEGNMGDHLGWARAAALLVNSFTLGIPDLVTRCEVREALEALEKKTGVARIELVVWAGAAVQKPVGRTYWEKMYISGTGKSSWKALTKFPERIRKMANELDRLCHSDYFGTEGGQIFATLPS